MPVAQLNTTTLSEALAVDTFDFTVGSTANIAVGNLIVVRGEAMKVQAIPVSGRVQVMRGVSGTYARPQPNGQTVYIGAPDAFKAIKDSALAIVGSSGNLPDYMLPGQKAKDDAGNEYVLVDLTAQVYTGVTVLISNDGLFNARVLVGGDQGSVGVMAEEGTSAQYAWAQIYGYAANVQDSTATSAASSTYAPTAATSVSTPAAGMAAIAITSAAANSFLINGMFIVGAATSATTGATSHTGIGVPCWLNYPWVQQIRQALETS